MPHPLLTPIALPPPAESLKGRLFRSPMPFRRDDGDLLDAAMADGVRVVVMLTSMEEGLEKARRDLLAEYASRSLVCIHLPIGDFEVPTDRGALESALGSAESHLQGGEGVLVHCAAGIGRTGLFLACLVGRVARLDGTLATVWVRKFIPGAVETPSQEDFVAQLLAPSR